MHVETTGETSFCPARHDIRSGRAMRGLGSGSDGEPGVCLDVRLGARDAAAQAGAEDGVRHGPCGTKVFLFFSLDVCSHESKRPYTPPPELGSAGRLPSFVPAEWSE